MPLVSSLSEQATGDYGKAARGLPFCVLPQGEANLLKGMSAGKTAGEDLPRVAGKHKRRGERKVVVVEAKERCEVGHWRVGLL